MPENTLTPATGAGQATSGKRKPGNRNNLVDGPKVKLPKIADSMLDRLHKAIPFAELYTPLDRMHV
jgi:hypothetical protein